MFFVILFVVVIMVAVLFVLPNLMKSTPVAKSDTDLYRPKALMSSTEIEFYGRLTEALPELNIFAQVSLGAILQPKVTTDKKQFHSIRGTFSQKIADFVVCDKTMNIVAIVELDDRTHNAERDGKRDAMLGSAGYKVIRWQAGNKPKIEEIAEKFKNLL